MVTDGTRKKSGMAAIPSLGRIVILLIAAVIVLYAVACILKAIDIN